MYASTLPDHICDFNVSILGYADDHSIYDAFDANSSVNMCTTIQNLEACLVQVNDWMNLNRLKMNTGKTEFMLLGFRAQLAKCDLDCIKVCDDEVERVQSLKYLGVYLDSQLNFKDQIKAKCKTCSINLYYIRQIRQYISTKNCQQLVQSLVISHIDYANALYYGLPAITLAPLQRIMNQAAKIVLQKDREDSATEAMRALHWLPIAYRSQFKIACLVYQALFVDVTPQYLKDLLVVQNTAGARYNTRSTVSDGTIKLDPPTTKRKTFADRSFSVAGPAVWKKLPRNVKLATSYNDFKKQLKMHYFQKAYG